MQATSNTFFRFWKGCQVVPHPVVATQSSHTSEWRVQLLYQYFFPTASGREFCWHYNCAVSSYPMCQHGVQFEEHGDPSLSHLSHLNFVFRNGWSITKLNHAIYVRSCYKHDITIPSKFIESKEIMMDHPIGWANFLNQARQEWLSDWS